MTSPTPPPSRSTTGASTCPGADELERLVASGSDAAAGGGAILEHIAGCPQCRERERLIRDNLSFMQSFLTEVGVPPPPKPGSGGDGNVRGIGDVASPDALPGYHLVREIARGGQGIVYEGMQIETRRRVAVKMIEPGGASGGKGSGVRAARARRRIERESEIAAGLRHPNIVTIYDSAALADGRYALAMEYVDGVTLDEWSRTIESSATTDRNSLREAIRTKLKAMAAVCDAVQYAHQNGVIHRDLKPANVLVSADGFPRVVDFGIARRVVPEPGITRAGEFAGTLAYASPEQVSGDPDGVDTRSDVYSLGVMLYEVLAARRPYETERSLTGAIANITRSDPDPLGSIQPGDQPAGDELETVVRKALAKDRAQRYQTAGALKADIDNWLAGRAVEAKRESTLYVLRKAAARHVGAVSAGAALVILLTAFAVAMAWSARRLDRQKNLLAESLASSTIERGRLLSMNGTNSRAESLIWPELLRTGGEPFSPDLGFNSSPEVTQAAWALYELYIRQSGLVHFRTSELASGVVFENNSTAIRAFGWDGSQECRSIPDGKLLDSKPRLFDSLKDNSIPDLVRRRLTAVAPGAVEIVDLDTGSRETLPNPLFADLWSATTSPDRSRLLTISADGVLRLWSIQPLRQIKEVTGGMGKTNRVAFSADGRTFAVGVAETIRAWKADDGEPAGVWRIVEDLWERALRRMTNILSFSPDGQWLAAGLGNWVLVFSIEHPEAPPVRIAAHRGFVNCICFSADSSVLFTSGNERSYRAWNPVTGERIGNMEQSRSSKGWPNINESGTLAAVCEMPDSLRVWEIRPRGWLTRIKGPVNSVHCVRFSPDGQLLAAAGADGFVRVWRADDHAAVWNRSHEGVPVTSLSFSPDGTTLATALSTGEVTLADAGSGDNSRLIGRGASLTTWVGFATDGRSIGVAGSDNAIHLLDSHTGAEVRTLQGHTARVVEAAFSHDGRELASASADAVPMVWDLATGKPRLRLTGHTAAVRAIAYSPDGTQIATGSDDWTIRLWDARTGQCVRTLRDAKQHIFGLTYHPNGNLLLSCCRDPALQVWDTRTGREVATLEGHENFVLTLALSPDGNTLASAGGDRDLALWNLRYYQTHVRGNADYWRHPDSTGEAGE